MADRRRDRGEVEQFMAAEKAEHEKEAHDRTPINLSDKERAALDATYQR